MKLDPDARESLARALDESLGQDVVASSLAHTLGAVRRKRRRRQGLTMAGLAGVVAAVALIWNHPGTPVDSGIVAASEAAKVVDPPRIRMEEISDAELLAMFPGRAAGFVTVNGQREFILLPDESAE